MLIFVIVKKVEEESVEAFNSFIKNSGIDLGIKQNRTISELQQKPHLISVDYLSNEIHTFKFHPLQFIFKIQKVKLHRISTDGILKILFSQCIYFNKIIRNFFKTEISSKINLPPKMNGNIVGIQLKFIESFITYENYLCCILLQSLPI